MTTEKREFNQATAPETGRDFLVNYVWINKEPDREDRAPSCSVSLKDIDVAYANARRYPDARVKVWIDLRFLDERSKDCLREHYRRFAPANASLCDLNDIPPYRDEKMFDPGSATRLWARVDLARLVVLDHVLETEPESHALYSDFDVRDIRLGEAREKISTYGVALATIEANDDKICKYTFGTSKGYLENSYFGFLKGDKGRPLIKTLLSRTYNDARSNQNGFCALFNTLSDWKIEGTPQHCTPVQIIVPHALNSQNYKIPDNPLYVKLGWNTGTEALTHR